MENTLIKTRRTRIVNFRVTEEEYARLRSASNALGINGISGYARQATLYLAERGGKDETRRGATASEPEYLLACLIELKTRLAQLEVKVERLLGPA